jgi:hypothetical protein
MTEERIKGIPFLDEIRVQNPPMPLHYAHWRERHDTGFQIRQIISDPKDGLNFILTQYDNTRRGVETLQGSKLSKDFLTTDKKTGIDEWLNDLCFLINQKIKGYKPIEKLERVVLRAQNTYSLAYYGSFYSDQMEIIIRIGFRENIDGATVFHRRRSQLDMTTRDIELLSEWFPQTVWIKEV